MTANLSSQAVKQRLLSLDFLRGLIMTVLLLGETGFFQRLHMAFENPFTEALSRQFAHSSWHGLRFWDTVLPAFMMVAGTAMAFSYNKQVKSGYSWGQSFVKMLKRCFWLMFWGVMIYAVKGNELNLEFTNVLTELSFAAFVTFLLIRLPFKYQLVISIMILILTELLFRFTNIAGFDQPFVDKHNFGSYIDLLLLGRVNGHTTTMNWIPCSVSTIWGMMAGQLLLSAKKEKSKISLLMGFGGLSLAAGLILDVSGITPMLKWISSSSFVMVNGGISLIALAICYYWIDVRKKQRNLKFFTIVGMNSIFIYLFFNFVGLKWMNRYIDILVSGLLNKIAIPVEVGSAIGCLVVFAIEWGVCYFLYKKKLFFKL